MKPIVILASLLISAAAFAAEWEPEAVIYEVRALGAPTFLGFISEEGGWERYEALLAKIESQPEDWIDVAMLLWPYTDAGASTALQVTLARSIQRAPGSILDNLDIEDIRQACSVPLIEPSAEEYYGFIHRTKEAVEQLQSPPLQEKREACLQELEIAQARKVEQWD